MKNKKWLIRIVVIVFIILAWVIGGFVVYKVINKDGKNIIDVFTGNEPSDENVKSEDNVNGFYEYTTVLSSMKKIHNNCSITEVKEYIAIINDEYRYYKSTCMGTFFKKSGNVTELLVQFSDYDNTYKIKYDDREFIKTPYVDFLEPGNLITNADKIFISEYKYLIKETQFDGAYYNISKPIAEGKNDFHINLESSSGTSYFTFNISTNETKSLYSFDFNVNDDLEKLPDFYYLDGHLIVLTKGMNGDRYADYFDILSIDDSNYYSLVSQLPLVIDGKVLDLNTNNRFVSYDTSRRVIRLIFGVEDKLCVTDYDENKKRMPLYYEFEVTYDLAKKTFSKPKYVKTGYNNEGCSYINKVVGEV